MQYISIQELERQVNGERPQRASQLAAAKHTLSEHPDAVLIECADEKTGHRFGDAEKRSGRCRKLGGARQPRYYQLWASWADADKPERPA